eukprot:gb/GECG01016713.1/.p1 GENE.gb/GECG01016713.1/~~gb/GECG01016713.1/.p1  ORF type:complete len:248 (+),score=12.78 gb/GECG01016713.1/:1-744(+)
MSVKKAMYVLLVCTTVALACHVGALVNKRWIVTGHVYSTEDDYYGPSDDVTYDIGLWKLCKDFPGKSESRCEDTFKELRPHLRIYLIAIRGLEIVALMLSVVGLFLIRKAIKIPEVGIWRLLTCICTFLHLLMNATLLGIFGMLYGYVRPTLHLQAGYGILAPVLGTTLIAIAFLVSVFTFGPGLNECIRLADEMHQHSGNTESSLNFHDIEKGNPTPSYSPAGYHGTAYAPQGSASYLQYQPPREY